MALTITLKPEIEARIRAEADDLGKTAEQLATQRLQEAELLWRIRIAAPETETRRLHQLMRRRNARTLTPDQQAELQSLLDEREQRSAQRMEDLAQLARLREMPVHQIMEQLAIRPIPSPGR